MKATVIPLVIGALETVPRGLIKELEELEITGRMETIQTTTLLRSARILRGVLEIWGDLLSLRLQWMAVSKIYSEKLASNNFNLTMRKNGIYTTQHLSWKMRRTNSSWVYDRDDQNISTKKKKKKKREREISQNCGLCCSGRPLSKLERLLGNWKKLQNMKVTFIPTLRARIICKSFLLL